MSTTRARFANIPKALVVHVPIEDLDPEDQFELLAALMRDTGLIEQLYALDLGEPITKAWQAARKAKGLKEVKV